MIHCARVHLMQVKPMLKVFFISVLCEACRDAHSPGGLLSHMTEYLPKKVSSYLQIPALPVESARSLAQRYTKHFVYIS